MSLPPTGVAERASAPRAPQLRKARGSRRRHRAIDLRYDGDDDDGGDDDGADDDGADDDGADDEGADDDGGDDDADDDPPSVRVQFIAVEPTSAVPVLPLGTFWNGSERLMVMLMPLN